MMILGMGKLGGRELNYSSDIDLIFLYPEEGQTDGARSIDNAEFFLRLGQKIVQTAREPRPSKASSTASICGCVRSATAAGLPWASARSKTICSSTVAIGSAMRT